MTIGPDGKPHLKEFGSVKSFRKGLSSSNSSGIHGKNGFDIFDSGGFTSRPEITAKRESLADINTTEKEVKIVLEMPRIKKEDIKINGCHSHAEITTTDNSQRKYHKIIELPEYADVNTARSTYNNGILEITFDKKTKEQKLKGKEIKVD